MKVSTNRKAAKEWPLERTLELVTHKELYPDICLQFIYQRRLSAHNDVLTSLEVHKTPLACAVYNLLEDLRAYLEVGSTETSFGIETDGLLAKLPATE